MDRTPRVLILGIGNILWADEGFGVRAIETFHQHFEEVDRVRVLEGGTQGIYLVQHVREADVLIVFDAVDYGLPGGTQKIVEGDAVPRFLGAKKVSLHQTGFQEVLAMAEMMGDMPERLVLIGVQPVEIDDYGGSLRPEVAAQIWPSIDVALKTLADLGISLPRRAEPLSDSDALGGAEIRQSLYEGERPAEADAYRHGDARVVFSHTPDAAE